MSVFENHCFDVALDCSNLVVDCFYFVDCCSYFVADCCSSLVDCSNLVVDCWSSFVVDYHPVECSALGDDRVALKAVRQNIKIEYRFF